MIRKQCSACTKIFPADVTFCDADGNQLATVLIDSLVNTTLANRYQLLSEIGRGGMGVVYKGKDLIEDRTVAVKMLINDLKQDDLAVRRFEVEAQACRALDHPNVIRLFDYDISEWGLPYIVMEYLNGETLQTTFNKERKLALPRSLDLFIQICNALDHAHRRQVLHRDLKPSNIVLERLEGGERAVLVDFGIAKLFAQAGRKVLQLTRTGEVFGSPLYMSPEQCMGQSLDHRSDIYSFGCLMYEILTGLPPLAGDSFLSTIFKHVSEVPLSFAQVAPNIVLPKELEDIVFKSLAKALNDRFQSMAELRSELEKVQESVKDGSSTRRGRVRVAFLDYRTRAENGDASAQFDLAWYHYYGDGVPEDKELAFQWFLRSAEQGYAPAQRQVGYMYEKGRGVGESAGAAFSWFEKAATSGFPRAQSDLAYCYEFAVGTACDTDMSFYWYLKAANQGFADAQLCAAWALSKGKGVEMNLEEAFVWYERAAEQGNNWAQYEVACCCRDGLGTTVDGQEAFFWMKAAAEAGVDMAQYDLAKMYQEGQVTGKQIDAQGNYLKWITRAAEGGSRTAQTELGRWYDEHSDSVESLEQAIRWLEPGAEEGDADAQERYFRCRKRLKEMQNQGPR